MNLEGVNFGWRRMSGASPEISDWGNFTEASNIYLEENTKMKEKDY
ncbi:MAG: hypothetical protein AAF573_09205 [Bacteroidota bacterium]